MRSRFWLIAAAVLWLLACALPAICMASMDSAGKFETLPGWFLLFLTVLPPAWMAISPLLGFLGNVCVWFGMSRLKRDSKPQSGLTGLAWIMTFVFVLFAFESPVNHHVRWTLQLTAVPQRFGRIHEMVLMPGFFLWWLSLAMTTVGLTLHALEAKSNDETARMEQMTRRYRGE